ncbi:MAG: sigma-54 dependent transcriptional regulator [Myxococcota bacterium]|nr:sigma-54 dependent transcriptional regulator [Myxococcota bacterium]
MQKKIAPDAHDQTILDDILICQSAVMIKLGYRIRRYAPTEANILITGGSGSGKERVANAVHRLSKRSDGPFIALNCAALPPQLIESELFGTTPGAFTGARHKRGWFERANGGTLFLDEIGDMPPSSQTKLLRVLETGTIWPVGSERSLDVNVRVLSATHQSLEHSILNKTFRLDLFHRISTLHLEVPNLKSRRDDLKRLAEALCPNAARRLTPSAWRKLEDYHWPGNVREFKNVLLRASIENQTCPISSDSIRIKVSRNKDDGALINNGHDDEATLPLTITIARYVQRAVEKHQGNVRATSRALRVSPTTVYRYLSLGVSHDWPEKRQPRRLRPLNQLGRPGVPILHPDGSRLPSEPIHDAPHHRP